MVLIILATLLILGIAFYQTVQGCFSAMIMAILTVLCAAAAFNYYEPLGALLADRLGAVADPAAMLAVFVIPLLALRAIFDRLIRGNVVLGLLPDRIGGTVFGLVTGMIMTGMFMIILQMLPMPASILTWRPYDSALGVKDGGPPRWAANFTLATAGRLSAKSLHPITSGKNLRISHDDLPLESFCLRNRPAGARASTPTDAMEVTTANLVEKPDKDRLEKLPGANRLIREITQIQDATPTYPLLSWQEKDDTKVLTIRVSIDESARNENDDWWRLPATHFRLVCEGGRSFYPVGYLTHAADWRVNTSVSDKQIAQVGDILVARQWRSEGGPKKLLVDWLYRIPSGEKPSYVVFRRTAKAELPPITKGLPGSRLALSVKPVQGMATLIPVKTGKRLFTPETVEVKDLLPDGIWIRHQEETRPAPIKQIEITGDKLRNAVIAGPVSELTSSGDRSVRYVTALYSPQQISILMQVQCKIDREFRGDSIIENLKPALLLNTGASVHHTGASLFYDVGGKKSTHFYYDFAKFKDRLDADFAKTFRENAANADTFGLIFAVPASENSIVALTFGSGDQLTAYEFHAAVPLECTRRR